MPQIIILSRMMKSFYLIGLISSLLLFSCGGDSANNKIEKPKSDSLAVESVVAKGEIKIIEPVIDGEIVILKENGITLTEVKSENNTNISLELNTKQFKEGGNHLSFSVVTSTTFLPHILEHIPNLFEGKDFLFSTLLIILKKFLQPRLIFFL